jgi:regulatory protein
VAVRRTSRAGAERRQPPAIPALDAGLRYLGRRAHSRTELRRKLERKGYGSTEIDATMERLAELGYLDDAAFARGLVRRRSAGRGPRALAAELAAKGIDRPGIAAALATNDATDQLEAATRLAERLYADKPLPGYRETLNRIGAKLVRRGFSMEVARAACRAVLTGDVDA